MRPTTAGWALLGLIVFAGALAPAAMPTAFITVAFMLGLLVVNAVYAARSLHGVSVRREHPTHVKEGAPLTVRLHVANSTRTDRFFLRFRDSGLSNQDLPVAALPGKTSEAVLYECEAPKRGVYSFGTCRIESLAPFGLVSVRRRATARSEMVVYPVYYELTGARLVFHKTFTGMTGAPGSRPGEGSSFFGLREYREGDPIRKVHWPTSLRSRSLVVKEFEEDMHSSVTVLVDTYGPSVTGVGAQTNMETAVRVAATLANYAVTNGHPTTQVYFDAAFGGLRYDRGMGEMTGILEGLARLDAGTMRAAELVEECTPSASRQSNWIAVLLSADEEALEGLLRVRAQGCEVTVVIVDAWGSSAGRPERKSLAELLGMLEAAGVAVVVMSAGDDIPGKLSSGLRWTTGHGAGRFQT